MNFFRISTKDLKGGGGREMAEEEEGEQERGKCIDTRRKCLPLKIHTCMRGRYTERLLCIKPYRE